MYLTRQPPSPIPTIFPNKRKSLTYHITRRYPKRHSNAAPFNALNSQLLSHQNSPDFTNIVTTFNHLPLKEQSAPPQKTPAPIETKAYYKQDASIHPLRVARYPSIKLELPKQPSKRTLRRQTEPAYSLTPTRFKLVSQSRIAEMRPSGESQAIFRRYQSPPAERKSHLNRMLPQLHVKAPLDKLVETAEGVISSAGGGSNSTAEIIKPWQTRRDLFHETFKRYIAEHRKQNQWTQHTLKTQTEP